ncbi:hypothetical protein [Streptomyces cyaneochromogenes]|nr:hypothetical protein [Streptomyces cyaneochromogenes]
MTHLVHLQFVAGGPPSTGDRSEQYDQAPVPACSASPAKGSTGASPLRR